ncbi:hypothetical protein GNF83_16755, partial [Clostridium perfringens]|nr:hypothetical protein [Clostridium perfringens]
MMRENIVKGTSIGFTLLISSILALRFTNDIENTLKAFQYFIPILIIYILIGIAIQYLHNLPPRKNINGTKGIESVYWLFLICAVLEFLASFIPAYIRCIVLV